MSSNKAAEILEKQRRIAEIMKKKQRPPPPPPPGPPPPAPRGRNNGVIDLTGRDGGRIKISKGDIPRKLPQSSTSTKGNSKAQAQLKRPSRSGFKRPSTGNAKIASVQRATNEIPRKSGNGNNEESSGTTSTSLNSNSNLKSSAIPRRTSASSTKISSLIPKSSFKKPSSLSNLVKNVASKNNSILDDGGNVDDEMTTMMMNSSYGSNASPEDFFKSLREWDFVGDLARQQQESSSRSTDNNNNSNNEDTTLPKKKPIPDMFISIRHYVSAWVPGILSETRAQILSEVLTEYGGSNRSSRSPFALVNVETTWKSARGRDRNIHADLTDMNACHVQLKTRERNDFQFYCHDICALLPVSSKDIVEKLLRGGQVKDLEESFGKLAMIGHTESNRRELNGLILKVSKRKWAQIGSKEMLVLKVGSNITALREFTALCKVQSIPLKKYLLGQHLEKKDNSSVQSSSKAITNSNKKAALKEMGGVNALGEGFTNYVYKKFNPSQLRAISAASRGYGDGGFTLIKGPPGTGKTTMLVAVLNSLHIRQYNKYYEEVRRIASMQSGNRQAALENARRAKPRLLVCAPSNAAVDNIIQKIMEDGFVDGSGQRYNPSMIRVGVGASSVVSDVALQTKVDQVSFYTMPHFVCLETCRIFTNTCTRF